MINVGLIGFGLSGRYLQAPFFQTNQNFNLKKIVTSQQIPQNLFPNTSRADSYEELLEDESLNLISICSPSDTHYEYAKKCLSARKNILIEKPITAHKHEAEELFRLAEAMNLRIFVFQNRRFDSDFMTVKSVIESGVLGEILAYEAHFDRFKPVLNAKKWKERIAPANGILYDLGSHLIDQSIYLFGNPEKISGEVFTQRAHSEIDDAFDLKLDYGKLKVSLKSSLMVKDQGPKYIVHGTLGSFTKYGIDIQEDHLVAGLWPNQAGFGFEPKEMDGTIKTSIKGLELKGKIETFGGNWNLLFDNIADVILQNAESIIKPSQIIEQITIIDTIKKKKAEN
ncbi:oxidoreductase [Lacihabitans sp. LS3-19]|uniref:Gfo/Idh/MocA family oxidoreductase n=1 Tax=Lacihabitans sp. LS3-19 TaxID=2487335 RepID=UPI0020CE7873|nr:Gfo/Idh/MocA family oxidoreductase [Lacihabitans sp. LS3-19]MCP9769932.1 oxidoreductase [Lacihabitans sp. LS3-19]